MNPKILDWLILAQTLLSLILTNPGFMCQANHTELEDQELDWKQAALTSTGILAAASGNYYFWQEQE